MIELENVISGQILFLNAKLYICEYKKVGLIFDGKIYSSKKDRPKNLSTHLSQNKVPPNGKDRGCNPERPMHLIDSNFRAVVFNGRTLFLFRERASKQLNF